MTKNRYFNFRNRESEQNLVEDLIIESIQIFGENIIYIPRDRINHDTIYGEDIISGYYDHFEIEGYVKNVDGFQGDGNIFRKFGLDIKDQMTFTFSRYRFQREVEGDLVPERPREGDLIFFPENEAMFEIKYVADETVFYQLGALYTYDCTCEQFPFSHEEVFVGIDAVDEAMERQEFSQYLYFGGGANSYIERERVYQGVDLENATFEATVIQVPDDTKIEVKDIKGEAIIGQNIWGSESGTTRILQEYNDLETINDASGINTEFETEGNSVIDFSEDNPFGEPDHD